MTISQDDLHAFLSGHHQAVIGGIAPVGLGEWSQAFFYTVGGSWKVIRFSAYDEDFKKDRFAARYSTTYLPVPPVEEIGEAFGQYFAISPRVEGTLIDHLPSDAIRRAVPALMDLFNALRAVDTSGTSGYGGFDAAGNAAAASWRAHLTSISADAPESRTHGWKEILARDKAAEALYREGRQRLLELVPLCPDERHLIHNDLLHFNLIIRDDRVAAVIDWGCALWGDFLYDLAMFVTWQFYYPAMAGIDFAGEAQRYFAARNIALPNFHERLQCYQIHLLLDSLAYNAWKQDQTNLGIAVRRLKEVLANPGAAAGNLAIEQK